MTTIDEGTGSWVGTGPSSRTLPSPSAALGSPFILGVELEFIWVLIGDGPKQSAATMKIEV